MLEIASKTVGRLRPWEQAAWWVATLGLMSLRLVELAFVSPKYFPDTAAYLPPQGPLSSFVLAGPRPPLTALVYWTFDQNRTAIIIAQALIATVAWTVATVALISLIRTTGARVALLAAMVVTSLSAPFLIWDATLLSESLSLSLALLVLAAAIRAVQQPSGWRIVALVTVVGLSMFSRDTNAVIFAAAALIVALFSLARRLDRRWLAASLAVIAMYGVVVAEQTAGHRSRSIVADEVLLRVLPSPSMLAYYEAHGMPVTPALIAYRGSSSRYMQYVAYDPALDSFREWCNSHGISTQLDWTVSHPVTALTQPFRDDSGLSMDAHLVSYIPSGYKALLPISVEHLAETTRRFLLWGEGLVALVVAIVLARRRTPLWWLAVGLLATAVPHAILVWNAEAMEVPRHGLLIDLQVRLGFILLGVALVDDILTRRTTRRALTTSQARTTPAVGGGAAARRLGLPFGREWTRRHYKRSAITVESCQYI